MWTGKADFFQTDSLKSDANRRVFNSVPLDVPMVGLVDVDGSGTIPVVLIATVAGPTVEVVQGLGDDNVLA